MNRKKTTVTLYVRIDAKIKDFIDKRAEEEGRTIAGMTEIMLRQYIELEEWSE